MRWLAHSEERHSGSLTCLQWRVWDIEALSKVSRDACRRGREIVRKSGFSRSKQRNIGSVETGGGISNVEWMVDGWWKGGYATEIMGRDMKVVCGWEDGW